MIYLCVFLLLLFFSLVEIHYPGKKKIAYIYFYVVIWLFLFFFVGFRTVGFDYDNYKYAFKYLSTSYWVDNAEYLKYELLYSYLNYFLCDYTVLIAVLSCFILVAVFIFIYKYSSLPFFSLFLFSGLFLYTFTMGQYRQMTAISVVLLGLVFYHKRIVLLLCIFIACLFHTSAIIAFAYLFIPNKLYSKRVYLILIALAFISNLTLGPFFFSMIGSFPPYIADKLEMYASWETTILGFNAVTIFRLLIIYLLVKYGHSMKGYLLNDVFVNSYILSVLIYIALGFLPSLAGRGTLYLMVTELVLGANLLYTFRNKLRVIFFVIYILLIAARELSFFKEWGGDYIPYKNILITNIL